MNFVHLSENIDVYLIIGALLFAIGIFGYLKHKTLVGMLIAGELVLAGASLNFMAFSHFHASNPVTGQAFTLFVIGIAAAEAAIALSIMIAVYRNYRSIETKNLNELEG